MTIEIVVGLPHLSKGPLLDQARAMQVPVLVSANAFSRWKRRHGCREWCGWRTRTLANTHGLASVDLDSAGFVLAVKERGIPWTVDDYIRLAGSFKFRRFASLDLCCEAEIAHNRAEVLDRVARTIQLNRACHAQAVDAGLASTFMPVLQGRVPDDYLRSWEGIAHLVRPGQVIGVGSLCRRHVTGVDGLIAVIDRLDRLLPADVRLHGFGVKGTALSLLAGFGGRVASIDSQAYGIAARREAYDTCRSKTGSMVARHMRQWTTRQHARATRRLPVQGLLDLPASEPQSNDPWQRALCDARSDIRALIVDGEIAYDQITDGWIEQWAAESIAA
ncbi:hypothetical protein [Sphingomonas sp. 1185]|uniref:deazapurine DNA modification protein DpdA family protein n=1 Tax=Sphingomonas sp. 1185 TaxID=3156411 RepID=UPI003398FCB6